MIEFNDANFTDEVLAGQGLAVVDFGSPLCIPCQRFAGPFAALAERYKDKAKFGKIDVAAHRKLAISQKVLGVPAVLFYRDGKRIAEFDSDVTAEAVEAKLQELLQSQA